MALHNSNLLNVLFFLMSWSSMLWSLLVRLAIKLQKLYSNSAGDYWGSLHICTNSYLCNDHLSNDWILWLCMENILVFLLNVLCTSLFQKSWVAACVHHPKLSYCYHFVLCFLRRVQSLCWLSCSETGKPFLTEEGIEVCPCLMFILIKMSLLSFYVIETLRLNQIPTLNRSGLKLWFLWSMETKI